MLSASGSGTVLVVTAPVNPVRFGPRGLRPPGSGPPALPGPSVSVGALSVALIAHDDVPDELMAHDVVFREFHEPNPAYVLQEPHRVGESRFDVPRYVYLVGIPATEHFGSPAYTGEHHLHLCRGHVLKLIAYDE